MLQAHNSPNIENELKEIKHLEEICPQYNKDFAKFYEQNLKYYEMIEKSTNKLIRKLKL